MNYTMHLISREELKRKLERKDQLFKSFKIFYKLDFIH